jgi:carbon-monoxide dehydrogenase medium subunit
MSPGEHLILPRHPHWEQYFRPRTISEALEILGEFHGDAKLIAGGTDVLVQMRRRELETRVLVDITQIPGLEEIRSEDGLIKIGARVTHSQVEESPLIHENAMALKEGASHVGSPQIRNLGTITGNIVSGQPGADTAIPLLALDAHVRVATKGGERTIPLTEFFIDTGKTAVDSCREMISEISFPTLGRGEASAYFRLSRRKALALPILAVCIVLSADVEKKRFKHVRIALGPVAPVPFRARETEDFLTGAPFGEAIIRQAAEKAAQESNPRTSPLRGSAAYRRAMIANLVERGIHKCMERLEVLHG